MLQQVHAATWHRVSQERWERGYRASVPYVDNTSKPLWSKQYVKSAKVATTGRVQPALVSTYARREHHCASGSCNKYPASPERASSIGRARFGSVDSAAS